MDKANKLGNLLAEIFTTLALVAVGIALILAWRTAVGQDDGVLKLVERFFG